MIFSGNAMEPQVMKFLEDYGYSALPQDRYITLMFEDFRCREPLCCIKDATYPSHHIIFGIHSIKRQNYQPIATVFWNRKQPFSLVSCITVFIIALQNAGFTVLATVSSHSYLFCQAIYALAKLTKLETTQAITYSIQPGWNIVHIFDNLLLFKEFRQHFVELPVRFETDGQKLVGDADVIRTWLNQCSPDGIPNNLLDDFKDYYHSVEETKTLFGSQVAIKLYTALENGEVPTDFKGTVYFIYFFEKLFSSLNNTLQLIDSEQEVEKQQTNFAFDSFESNFWMNSIQLLQSLFFLKPDKMLWCQYKKILENERTGTLYNNDTIIIQNDNYTSTIVDINDLDRYKINSSLNNQKKKSGRRSNKKSKKQIINLRNSDTQNGNNSDKDNKINETFKEEVNYASESMKSTIESLSVILKPAYVRLWVCNMMGMMKIVDILREKRFKTINTKNFSINSLIKFMHMVNTDYFNNPQKKCFDESDDSVLINHLEAMRIFKYPLLLDESE